MASEVILYRDLIRFPQLHRWTYFHENLLRFATDASTEESRLEAKHGANQRSVRAWHPLRNTLGRLTCMGLKPFSGPAKESERILALDTLRGVAALGILAMNIQYFSGVTAAYSNPTLAGSFTGFDFWLWLLARVFFDEKMIAIFWMLYGAGIVLLTSRIETRGLSQGCSA